jgi:hypothetical protein
MCELTPEAQAIFCRRRHQPRRPLLAKIRPGIPAPTIGPGTAAGVAGAENAFSKKATSCIQSVGLLLHYELLASEIDATDYRIVGGHWRLSLALLADDAASASIAAHLFFGSFQAGMTCSHVFPHFDFGICGANGGVYGLLSSGETLSKADSEAAIIT